MRVYWAVLLILILPACSSADKNPKSSKDVQSKGSILYFDATTGKYSVASENKKLINAWELFRELVVNKDYAELKAVSAICIYCPSCPLGEGSAVIPVDEFYSIHARKVFNDVLISHMTDSLTVKAREVPANSFVSDPCTANMTRMQPPKMVQIFVSYPLPKGQSAGTTAVLDFIETINNYEFCGYRTIP